jgi:single-stranded-DNA-specific exonuclease
MKQQSWNLLPPAPREFLEGERLPPLILQVLYNRALRDPACWEAFLTGDERLCHDPFLLPEMEKGVERLRQAIHKGETIGIYGDYDADGITATVLLVQGLEALGARTLPYIPTRLQGHGLHSPALEGLFQQGASLVLTVDTGTNGYEEVAQAQRRGQDVIITDHHVCPALLPPAVAIVNPRRHDSLYPFPDLTGVGVACKLLQALLVDVTPYLDLVALGTVSDVAPLLGENRYLVKEGLRLLNTPHRPGIREMLRCSGLERVDAGSIAWVLGPRLNAAARLEHPLVSYHLLLTPSTEEAQRLADELERMNAERQRLTNEALVWAREQAMAQGDNRFFLVQSGDVPLGVAGLVANRLMEEFYRPVVVMRLGPETSSGSGRSIPEFNLVAALHENEDLLLRYGGHPRAAGFTIINDKIPRLQERLVEKASQDLKGLDLRPQIVIDAQISLAEPNSQFLQFLPRLAPFGFGNPNPVFLCQGTKVMEAHRVGDKAEHLRLKLRAGPVTWDAIAFDCGGEEKNLSPYLDVVYSFSTDCWSPRGTLELELHDFRTSA